MTNFVGRTPATPYIASRLAPLHRRRSIAPKKDACLERVRPTADKSQLGGAPGYCRVVDPSGPRSRSIDLHNWLGPGKVALHLRMLYVALEATNAVPPDNFPRPVANPAKGVPTAEDALNAEHFGRGEAYCTTREKFRDREVGNENGGRHDRNHEWWAKIELPSQK